MINVAVIGYGRSGEAHARCFDSLPNGKVAAVVDPTPARRDAAHLRFPTVQAVASIDELLDNVDLVLVCTPPTSHEEYIEQALVRGMHAFCEKPAFLNPTNAKRLIALARSRGKIIYPGHNYLYSPQLRYLRKLATAEYVGALQRVEIAIERTAPATGTADWNPTWRTNHRFAGGGILVDHGPHGIYLAEWLTGQYITGVACTMAFTSQGLEDHAELTMTMTSDITAQLVFSWRSHQRSTSYRIVGTDGTATLDNDLLEMEGSRGRGSWKLFETPGTHHAHDDWLPSQAADVLRAIRDDTANNESLTTSALTVARTIEAARTSAAARSIPVPIMRSERSTLGASWLS
jgi:predicted dehydrogenase